MHCTSCGTENPEDSRFCRNCGTALTGQPAGTAAAETAAAPGAVHAAAAAPDGESVLWEGHPSLRTVLPQLALFGMIYLALAVLVYFLEQRFGPQAPGFWRFAQPVVLIAFALILGGILLRHFLQLRALHYRITTQRLFIEHGLFSKRLDEVELEHYKDITVHRTFLDRMVGCGDVEVLTNDPTHLTVTLTDVHDPIARKEILRSAVEARKRSLGIVRREEL